MTIDEASKKWGCNKNTVLSYLYKEYIAGIIVDGTRIQLPDIPKPYIPRKRMGGSIDYYKAILRTIQKEQFIDENILCVFKKKFDAYLKELVREEYIKKVESDSDDITGYILTKKGTDEISKKGKIIITNEVNIQSPIGLLNIQNSLG